MAWTTPKTWVAAEFVDAAEMNQHVRDNLNYLNDLRVEYAQITADTSAFSTTETTIVTAPAFTPISASRLLVVMVHVRGTFHSDATNIFEFRIKEGATKLQEITERSESASTGSEGFTMIKYIASPTAAAHTYHLAGQRVLGGGTCIVQANATYPTQIIVQDIGAA